MHRLVGDVISHYLTFPYFFVYWEIVKLNHVHFFYITVSIGKYNWPPLKVEGLSKMLMLLKKKFVTT